MKQIDDIEYEVTNGEQVTIAITPSVSLGSQYGAVLDGKPQMPRPANGVYTFPVTKPAKQSHRFKIVFGFIGAPAGSKYSIRIDGSGSGNKGPFTQSVDQDDPAPDRTFRFRVV